MKRLVIEIADETHTIFAIEAARAGTSIKEVVTPSLEALAKRIKNKEERIS